MSIASPWLSEMAQKVAEAVPQHSIPWVLHRLRGLRERLQRVDVTLQMLGPQDRLRSGNLGEVVRVVSDLIRDPVKLQEVRPEDIPPVLAVMAALETALAARLMSGGFNGRSEAQPEPDRLLTAAEAATLLRVTPRWLYRRAGRLPFARRLSRKALRFSEVEIRRWMAAKRPS